MNEYEKYDECINMINTTNVWIWYMWWIREYPLKLDKYVNMINPWIRSIGECDSMFLYCISTQIRNGRGIEPLSAATTHLTLWISSKMTITIFIEFTYLLRQHCHISLFIIYYVPVFIIIYHIHVFQPTIIHPIILTYLISLLKFSFSDLIK